MRLKQWIVILFLLAPSTLPAQYYYNYFGTNKVNYTDFSWKILETEHFEIYYYPEMLELAERAAGMAEEQYLELQNRFNHSLVHKVPMIIFSSHIYFQQTNVTPFEIPEGVGGFFEFFKGRVVLPSDGSSSHFRRVLRHELVHVFMDSKVNRIISNHRKLNNPGPPLWFTEGLAELWSGEPDHQAEMVIRDAAFNSTILPVEEFYKVQGTYYMYKLGENFLHFVEERYGREKILLIMENIWKSDTFEKVIEMSLGKKYASLSEEWIYWVKKKYFPALEDNDVPSAISSVITKEGFNSKPAYYAHDGKEEIFYVANRDGYTNIYRQELGSSHSEVVIAGERSNDYETFHFFKSRIDVNHHGELAFVSKSGEKDVLYIYDVAKKEITHKYMYKDLVGIASPSWSPDGQSIAFSGLAVSGDDDLYTIKVSDDDDDGTIRKLTNDFYDDKDPAWSPDGKFIVFSSDRNNFGVNGSYNLYLYDLEMQSMYCLTTGDYHDESPAWSPDGRWLAFSSNRVGTSTDIWVLPFKDGDRTLISELREGKDETLLARKYAPRKLTHLTTAVFDPVWTNSGDLLFSAFEQFSFKIRQMPAADQKSALADKDERTLFQGLKYPWSTPKVPVTQANTRPYIKKYGLDFVQGAFQADPVFGSGGGAQIGITDMLGNDQYYLVLYNTATTSKEILTDWNFVLTKVDLGQRTNFAYGIFRFRGDFYEIADDGEVDIVNENRYGGFLQVTYPLSKFERIETNLNFSRFKREPRFALLGVDGVLVSNFTGYTFDNSLWGPTGPLDGTRAAFTLGYTTDVYQSQQNYYTAIFDYRKYFRLTTRSAYAVRALVEWNDGRNPQNFLLGGSYDLRGYPRWNMPGTRFFVVNNELRFPFVDAVNLRLPFGGLGFRSIRGAAFLDVGSAWGSQETVGNEILRKQKFDGLIGSVGTGFRVNLLGFLVLRFDFGKMFDARGYEFAGIKLPGNRKRFIDTRLAGNEGFGGLSDDSRNTDYRRWSRGIFFQFWFGADF
ncbi:BamA/TamA family outer membrane protein [bacterium]|nr:BamA/TamA family outer membrane protein [bacterium]